MLIVTSTGLFAQFTITGEVRPRTEFRNGFKRLHGDGVDPAFFIEQRSRLYMDYSKEKLSFNITLQDIRTWGNASQIYKTDPALNNVYEAWGKYAFDDKHAVKVGRQAMDYDNARFLGNLDWAQQGRSHDALMFIRQNAEKQCELNLAFAYNQNMPFEPGNLAGTAYFGVNNYKTMLYGWWHKNFDNGKLSLLFHNDGRQAADTTMANRQTYGVVGGVNAGDLKLDGEFYYQGGKDQFKNKVSAYLFALHATLSTDLTPITLGCEYLSGTSIDDDKNKSFDPLYGTNHKFYGYMDYFYVGNYHGQIGSGVTSGLIDLHLKTNFKMGEKSSLAAALHYFASPAKIYKGANPGNDTYNASLGTEIDLVYSLALAKDVKFNLGYSQMFGTETMEVIKSGGDRTLMQNWAWAMIAFKPQLFTSAKEQ
ncbi:MAG: alginate export family protein [Cyclobacteriaceae bacterium]|nr:alginate export family protein [Cyclobacteriaceae bacterium]